MLMNSPIHFSVYELYQDIAFRVIDYLKLPCNSENLDKASFHLDGDYKQDIDAN